MRMVGATIEEKFFAHTFPEPNTGCWLWGGYTNGHGYGVIWIKHKGILAHRFSFEYHKRQKLGDLFACHICNNTYCVNPDHLYAGTQKMNMRQAYDQGRFGGGLYPKKPIAQMDLSGKLIRIYDCVMDAARMNGFQQPTLSSVCSGKIKTAYGFKWAFVQALPDAEPESITEEETQLATA
jgi:hypothetical protein